MRLDEAWPPSYLWRYLVHRQFQRAHPDTPVMVGNATVTLASWLRPDDVGFEWGSGQSTTWLAPRVGHLTSVEHDPRWHARIRSRLAERGLADKVDYRHVPAPGGQLDEPENSDYAHAIDAVADRSLDFVVVDGQMRLRCMQRAIDKLAPMGLLVLDGANRYVPNDFEGGHTTVRINRSVPLDRDWAEVLERLAGWRAIHTTDMLWDTRMWVRPGERG